MNVCPFSIHPFYFCIINYIWLNIELFLEKREKSREPRKSKDKEPTEVTRERERSRDKERDRSREKERDRQRERERRKRREQDREKGTGIPFICSKVCCPIRYLLKWHTFKNEKKTLTDFNRVYVFLIIFLNVCPFSIRSYQVLTTIL